MRIIELSEDQYLKRLGSPYNAPDDSVCDTEFDDEYYDLFDKLEPLMAEFGTNNAYGDGDYCLEPRISRSRGLGFEVSNDTIVTEELLRRLQELVATHAPEWEIFLQSGFFEYGIFVGSSEIRIHRNNPGILVGIHSNALDIS